MINADGTGFITHWTNTIFRFLDGGVTFSNVMTGLYFAVDGLYFINNNTGFAPYVTSSGIGIIKTIDGGKTWTAISPVTGIVPNYLGRSSCCFIDANTGWLTYGGQIFRTNGSVNNWTESIIPGNNPNPLDKQRIFATSANVVYVASSGRQRILKSVDGGTTFTESAHFPEAVGYSLVDIHFLDANTGYACYGNHIYKTTDAGGSWQPIVRLGKGSISGLHFTDASHGWASTTDGSVLIYKP